MKVACTVRSGGKSTLTADSGRVSKSSGLPIAISLANNTQANNYRNLSGELAQHLATVYLRRADLTLTDAVPNVERITRIPNADGEVVIVRPPDTHSRAQGTVALYLKEGNTVRFSDSNGLRVRAQGSQKAPLVE